MKTLTLRRSPATRLRAVALALSFLFVSWAGLLAAEPCPESDGAESPQALLDGVREAAKSGELGELARYLSPGDRVKAVLGLTVGATLMMGFQKAALDMGESTGDSMDDGAGDEGADDAEKAAQKAEMEAELARIEKAEARLGEILARYDVEGFDEDQMGAAMQGDTEGLDGLEESLKDVCVVGLVAELGQFLGDFTGNAPKGPMEKLQAEAGPIEIDGDVATTTLDGEEIKMQRIDGRWYVDLESTSGGG